MNENVHQIISGDFPFPVCSNVSKTTANADERRPWGWIESTPFSLKSIDTDPPAEILMSEFVKIANGTRIDCNKLHYMMALWGSAFAIPLSYLTGEIKMDNFDRESIFGGLISRIVPGRVLNALSALSSINIPTAVATFPNFSGVGGPTIDLRD